MAFKSSLGLRLFFSFLLSLALVACGNDDDVDDPVFPPVNRGDVEANRLKITFTLNSDSTQSTFEFFDPDGVGGANPVIVDTIKLLKPTSGNRRQYNSSINFFNGTTPVTQEIIDKDNRYIVCYRNLNKDNLRFGNPDLDRDGINLGINGIWSTISTLGNPINSGTIRITLNFQPLTKDGTCDPGIRILEANMPYIII